MSGWLATVCAAGAVSGAWFGGLRLVEWFD